MEQSRRKSKHRFDESIAKELSSRFTKALRKHIKKEIHKALLKTHRVDKSNRNLGSNEDRTFDTVLKEAGVKHNINTDKLSHSSSFGQREQYSIEEELMKEITASMTFKVADLKTLFNEMGHHM